MGFLKKKKKDEYKQVPEPQPKPLSEDVNPMDKLAEETKEEQIEEAQATKGTWSLRDVATQSETVIYNEKEKKVYTIAQAIVELLNRTE